MPPEEQNQIAALEKLIIELKIQIARMDDRQEEMLDDIKMIKKAVYDPNEGLYARLRDLEQWKETTSKVMWMIITTVVGLTTATLYGLIIQ
jgi:hypothetical protein